MTRLWTWPDDDPTTVLTDADDRAVITGRLTAIGVRLDQWDVVDLPERPTPDEVLTAYAQDIARVRAAEGYGHVDAVGLAPGDDPDWPATADAARRRFLAEHTHADDEDRYFAQGSGIFYLHVDHRVHAVLCEAGDLLSVPAGTTHWFDMGTRPHFTAVRFFHDEQGWVGDFTGSTIAERFPDFDTLTARPPLPTTAAAP
jgi:1,2-dihydroxy-3-keto-5-methylthiopentene dioxygenase